jgi:Domain of unknown function (DUF5107)
MKLWGISVGSQLSGYLRICCLFALAACVPVFPAVTMIDSTTTWHTNTYTVNADYGLANVQANTRVTKTFPCKVIDNEYLKIIVVPGFGGRIVSMVYKPTNHEELYTTPCGVPYGINQGNFYYNWLMVYSGIMPTFSEPEHGKFWQRPWLCQIVKQTADTVAISMSQKDTVNFAGRPGKFAYGATGIECTFTVSIISGKNYIDISVLLNNPAAQSKNFEYWTMTTLAPGSSKTDPRTTAGAEIVCATKNCDIPGSYGACRGQEQNVGGDVFVLNKLRWWKNWPDMGIVYAWPDATTPMNTFWGVINHDNREGIIRISNNDQTIGLKMWTWGYPQSVNADVNSNTNTDLPYIELWAGISKMFFSSASLGAGQQKTWKEYFVPTVKIDSVTHANQDVVCNFKTDKASYNATADAGVAITAELFFTAPNQQDRVSLTFGGTQNVVVLDSTVTADLLGNVITKTIPFANLCNGLTKVTLKALSPQGGQLISADIPVTITNAQSCSALGVNNPIGSLPAAGANRGAAGKIYSMNGKFVGTIFSGVDLRSPSLPRGVYIVYRGSATPKRVIVENLR